MWVIGMIRGTAAERAGVEQGDQLLAVDGRALDGASPFQAANLLMGALEEGPAAAPPTAVSVTARPLCLPALPSRSHDCCRPLIWREQGNVCARPLAAALPSMQSGACMPQ